MFGVVEGMDFVKSQPLVDAQRAKNRVVEHLSTAELLSRAARRLVEPGQIARHGREHRIQIELARRDDVLRRVASFRKKTELNQRELIQSLLE